MEVSNQEKVWDAIAHKWQEYRKEPIKEAVNFIKKSKGKILDLGCGSGRNFTKTEGTIYAVDFSEEMLEYARERAKKLKINVIAKKANAYDLPFEDNFFDAAIFVATLHCIETRQKREKSLREIYRILKPQARALITVWDKNQPRFKKSKKEIMLPWRIGEKEYMRYTYLYEKDELAELLRKVGFKILDIINKDSKTGFYSKRNILVYIQKPDSK